MSLIRDVLLAGNFRTRHELDQMPPADQRKTLITELGKRTKRGTNFKDMSNRIWQARERYRFSFGEDEFGPTPKSER